MNPKFFSLVALAVLCFATILGVDAHPADLESRHDAAIAIDKREVESIKKRTLCSQNCLKLYIDCVLIAVSKYKGLETWASCAAFDNSCEGVCNSLPGDVQPLSPPPRSVKARDQPIGYPLQAREDGSFNARDLAITARTNPVLNLAYILCIDKCLKACNFLGVSGTVCYKQNTQCFTYCASPKVKTRMIKTLETREEVERGIKVIETRTDSTVNPLVAYILYAICEGQCIKSCELVKISDADCPSKAKICYDICLAQLDKNVLKRRNLSIGAPQICRSLNETRTWGNHTAPYNFMGNTTALISTSSISVPDDLNLSSWASCRLTCQQAAEWCREGGFLEARCSDMLSLCYGKCHLLL